MSDSAVQRQAFVHYTRVNNTSLSALFTSSAPSTLNGSPIPECALFLLLNSFQEENVQKREEKTTDERNFVKTD